MSSKKRRHTWFWVALLAVGGSALGAWRAGWLGGEEERQLLGAPVERKTLVISVVQRGNLASKDALSVKSEIEGQTTILSLIEEGTTVQPGDLLCELDVSDLRDRRVAQEISVQNAEAAYVKAKAQFEIQESQNKSDIEAAERRLLFATKDREKYLEGDLAQLRAQAQEKIKLAEAEKAKSQNTYDWSKSLEEKGFLTKTELDRDELDFQRAEVSLLQAQRAFDLLERYDDPRRRIELDANVHEAERGLERARLQAEARLADYESSLLTSKSKLDLEKEKFDKILEQIAKGRILARQAGMVVYARVEGGGRMGSSEPIQVGTTVRERQEILSIPRTTGIIVEASIHESVLKQVTVGKPCRITVDALRDQQFDGRVTFVALLPDKGSWWSNPNQRVYRTEIQVLNPHPEMRPGMSCGIEILSEVVPDALVAPLQAIFLDEGKTIAFVARGQGHERRPVKTGRSSQTLVEIVEGLKVGETVLLSPPAGFSPKAAEGGVDAASSFPEAGPTALPDAAAGRPRPEGVAPLDALERGEGAPRGEGGARPRGEGRPRPEGGAGGRRGLEGAGRPENGAARPGGARPDGNAARGGEGGSAPLPGPGSAVPAPGAAAGG
ncbi:MAG: efflux RND transporter periplasmic adaptor subunit [Planctomycetes bacterium]|nr:efflux RND transporter periplasmic adaptor subunit [Planctomycetota bacterium]